MRVVLGLYGNVKIPRVYCKQCKRWALVVGGKRQCCGRQIIVAPVTAKRMSSPPVVRKQPKQAERKRLLELFQDACAYCEKTFDSWTAYHGRPKRVRLNWDHQVPWVYSQNNRKENFLPACRFCNSWKGSLIFRTIEEVKIYVHQKWEDDKTNSAT